MSGAFSADWLALREPYDHAARSPDLVALAAGHRPGSLSILDLGAGAGSNLRFVAPRLDRPQRWRLIDNDAALLATAADRSAGGRVAVVIESRDLAADPHGIDLTGVDIVTASALIDLVSADWLMALTRRTAAAGCAMLFALTYDGVIAWSPEHKADVLVTDLVNRHQRTDKGFGPALGPDAATFTAPYAARNLRWIIEPSDWVLGPADTAIQEALIDDWANAAATMAPDQARAISDWRRERRAIVADGRSHLRVGHVDILAGTDLPTGRGQAALPSSSRDA